MMNPTDKKKNSDFGAFGYCLAVFLIILYFKVIGLYGLKFATGVVISWFTGGMLWFVRLLFQKADDKEGVDKPFNWYLFLLFPLFMPLSMPLWIIPVILLITYLVTVSAFGGHSKHIFNPIAVAVVFMLYGYGDAGLLNSSRPFAASDAGYKIWSSGIPPKSDIREVYSELDSSLALKGSLQGVIPTIPGSCFGIIVLAGSVIFSLCFKRRLIWCLTGIGSLLLFAFILPQPAICCIKPFCALFLGIMPSLILSGIADFTTLPQSWRGQILYGGLFGFFAALMMFYSPHILAPAYGLLLTQTIAPLLMDIAGLKND